MTAQVWCELKYGMGSDSITLARLQDPQVLAAFKRRAITRAERNAQDSQDVDQVLHLQDKTELDRLKGIFDLITPKGADNDL